MPFSTHTYGAIIIGAAFGIGGSATIPLPEKPFLTVNSKSVSAEGQVVIDREINVDFVIADWRVTIVESREGSDDIESERPVCTTIPGTRLHEGWSDYSRQSGPVPMSLDVWVGDPGCWDRLPPGEYKEFVTWTPRDGSPPVSHSSVFKKP